MATKKYLAEKLKANGLTEIPDSGSFFTNNKLHHTLKKIENEIAEDAEKFYSQLAKHFQIPYINFSQITIDSRAISLFNKTFIIAQRLIPFKLTKDQIHLATSLPIHDKIIEYVKKISGLNPIIHIAEPRKIAQYISDIKMNWDIPDLSNKKKLYFGNSEEEKLVRDLILYAESLDTTIIEIINKENKTTIRYRNSAGIKKTITPARHQKNNFADILKKILHLEMHDRLSAKNKKITLFIKDRDVNIYVSVMQTEKNEIIKIELEKNKPSKVSRLKHCGFNSEDLKFLEKQVKHITGPALILICGEINNVSQDLYYAFAGELKKRLSTHCIESNIRQLIEGIGQTKLDNCKTISRTNIINAVARIGTELICIDELDSIATAKTAFSVAEHGALVITCLETSNTENIVRHLNQLNIDNKLITKTLLIQIRQVEVPRLCPYCIVKTATNEFHSPGCKKCDWRGHQGYVGVYGISSAIHDYRSDISTDAYTKLNLGMIGKIDYKNIT